MAKRIIPIWFDIQRDDTPFTHTGERAASDGERNTPTTQ